MARLRSYPALYGGGGETVSKLRVRGAKLFAALLAGAQETPSRCALRCGLQARFQRSVASDLLRSTPSIIHTPSG